MKKFSYAIQTRYPTLFLLFMIQSQFFFKNNREGRKGMRYFHLGLPHLFNEWKNLFSRRYLSADITAGITVAFVAIPLSLAIALASGVSPGAGLITAIVAGIVCALFGGAPLTVSGPAAAMSVLIATNVENFGVEAVTVMCL